MGLGQPRLDLLHDLFVLGGFGRAVALEAVTERHLVGAAVAVIDHNHFLDVVKLLGDVDVAPERPVGFGKLVRHRGQRRAGRTRR